MVTFVLFDPDHAQAYFEIDARAAAAEVSHHRRAFAWGGGGIVLDRVVKVGVDGGGGCRLVASAIINRAGRNPDGRHHRARVAHDRGH